MNWKQWVYTVDIVDFSGRVEIEALGAKGDGLADGLAVALTLPGDVIENGKLVTRSPHRIRPPCPHFGRCGGCALQHADDAFVADWKSGVVAQALRAHALPSDIRKVHQSPARSRRRAVFAGRRTKKTTILGFHARRSDEVIPIDSCAVLRPEIMAAFASLHEIVRLAASRKSVVRLGVTLSGAGLDLDVRDAVPLEAQGIEALARFAEVLARISWNGEVVLMRSPPMQQFGPAAVAPPSGAFLQATAEGEAALVASVLEATAGVGRIVELFAGCGTFSLPLLVCSDVHAVEFEEEMLASLDQAWRQTTGLKRLTTEARDLFRRPVLSSEFNGVDAVVLDPPRAGAVAQAHEIAGSRVGRVAYVSCNPVSFAKDARVLVDAGFALDWVDVVDQFRWSTHIELAARFSRS